MTEHMIRRAAEYVTIALEIGTEAEAQEAFREFKVACYHFGIRGDLKVIVDCYCRYAA